MGLSRDQSSKPISQINPAEIGPLSSENMMVSLFQKGYDLPKNSSQDMPESYHKSMDKLVAAEAGFAKARSLLKHQNSHTTVMGNIKANIAQLGNDRSTYNLQEAFTPELQSLDKETKENNQQREKLTTELNKHLTDLKAGLQEISTAAEQKDFAKIETIAQKIAKAENAFSKEVDRLKTNEIYLTRKVDILEEKTFMSVSKENRKALATPPAFKEQETARPE